MLGKLIKYEWKNTYKMCGIILISLAAVTLMGMVSLRIPGVIATLAEKNADGGVAFLTISGILSMIVYILMLMVASYGVMIYIAVHFYKSMYSDEGYLTHTLPVTSHQLLISKWLVGGIWQLIVIFTMILSIIILVATGCELYAGDSLFHILKVAFDEGCKMFGTGNLVGVVVMYVVLIVAAPFCSMLMVFGSITLGQLFRKHRVLMAFVCYLGVSIVNYIISSLASIPVALGAIMAESSAPTHMYTGTYTTSFVVNVAVAVALYFVSHYILTKKFDIE